MGYLLLAVINIAAIYVIIAIGGRVASRFDHPLPGFVAGAAAMALLCMVEIMLIGPDNFRCEPRGKYADCASNDEYRAR